MSTSIIYFYNRQSTQEQNLANGRLQLYEYLHKNNLKYDSNNLKLFEEHASGYTKSYQVRLLGTDILPLIKELDILIVTEVSRISRKLSNVLEFIEKEVTPKKFKLHIIKNNMIIDDSPMNKLIISVFGMCAEMEINYLKERTKNGIKRYKSEHDGKWGRPKATIERPAKRKLDEHKEEIFKLVEMNVKKIAIAKKFNVTPTTMYNFIKKNTITK